MITVKPRLMEENWADIKLLLATELVFYEVKSVHQTALKKRWARYSDISLENPNERKKRIVVVGQFPPNAISSSVTNTLIYLKPKLQFGRGSGSKCDFFNWLRAASLFLLCKPMRPTVFLT